jgi:hypothetical protein
MLRWRRCLSPAVAGCRGLRAGALVGLAAGAVSALGYSLHCMDDTVPFVAVWYGGTIALCTLAGAVLGPRLLRW